MVFKSLFRRAVEPVFDAGSDRLIYAIGDVHGRIDCLDTLLTQIERDHAARGGGPFELILLGDLVDRGPDSRRTVERAMALARGDIPTTILAGNHEELLLRSAEGDRDALATFDRAGGRATLISYGVDPAAYDRCALADVPALIRDAVPPDHLDFLRGLENWVVRGEYVFVHAGVRPGLPLDEQVTQDLRWIREPFLGHAGPYGAMIVHGHTIAGEPEVRANRIGIDTGAYRSGVLTALGLFGTDRWFLQTDCPAVSRS